jgi:hypothetical protein
MVGVHRPCLYDKEDHMRVKNVGQAGYAIGEKGFGLKATAHRKKAEAHAETSERLR